MKGDQMRITRMQRVWVGLALLPFGCAGGDGPGLRVLPAGVDPALTPAGPYTTVVQGGDEIAFDVWLVDAEGLEIRTVQQTFGCGATSGGWGAYFVGADVDKSRSDWIFADFPDAIAAAQVPEGCTHTPPVSARAAGATTWGGAAEVPDQPRYLSEWHYGTYPDAMGFLEFSPMYLHEGTFLSDINLDPIELDESNIDPLRVVVVPQQGACCLEGHECWMDSFIGCVLRRGTYLGGGTTCLSVLCGLGPLFERWFEFGGFSDGFSFSWSLTSDWKNLSRDSATPAPRGYSSAAMARAFVKDLNDAAGQPIAVVHFRDPSRFVIRVPREGGFRLMVGKAGENPDCEVGEKCCMAMGTLQEVTADQITTPFEGCR